MSRPITGQVLSTSCQPVAQALVDFWQADNAGQHDNSGYRLRGHPELLLTVQGTGNPTPATFNFVVQS